MLKKLSKNVKITLSILFIFIGIVLLSYTYFASIKSNLFNYKNIVYLEQEIELEEEVNEIIETPQTSSTTTKTKVTVDSKDNYIGYLEVPDAKIKRGFLDLSSKYNSIKYNVMLIKGSTMPDIEKGNLILAAHRGNSSVSFFDKLDTLKLGAKAIVTYNNKKYTYKLVNSYLVPKVGHVTIKRNAEATVLTLVTCTRGTNKTQTIYIFELESIK